MRNFFLTQANINSSLIQTTKEAILGRNKSDAGKGIPWGEAFPSGGSAFPPWSGLRRAGWAAISEDLPPPQIEAPLHSPGSNFGIIIRREREREWERPLRKEEKNFLIWFPTNDDEWWREEEKKRKKKEMCFLHQINVCYLFFPAEDDDEEDLAGHVHPGRAGLGAPKG